MRADLVMRKTSKALRLELLDTQRRLDELVRLVRNMRTAQRNATTFVRERYAAKIAIDVDLAIIAADKVIKTRKAESMATGDEYSDLAKVAAAGLDGIDPEKVAALVAERARARIRFNDASRAAVDMLRRLIMGEISPGDNEVALVYLTLKTAVEFDDLRNPAAFMSPESRKALEQ